MFLKDNNADNNLTKLMEIFISNLNYKVSNSSFTTNLKIQNILREKYRIQSVYIIKKIVFMRIHNI